MADRRHHKLEEALGSDEASTLMEHRPPWRWGQVATKSDIATLQRGIVELSAGLSEVKADLSGAKAKLTGVETRVGAEVEL